MELRTQELTRYILPMREGGSLPALAVAAAAEFNNVAKLVVGLGQRRQRAAFAHRKNIAGEFLGSEFHDMLGGSAEFADQGGQGVDCNLEGNNQGRGGNVNGGCQQQAAQRAGGTDADCDGNH